MLNAAYKLGAAQAMQEALHPEDPPQIQELVSQLTSLKDPKRVDRARVSAHNSTDVTKGVSWGAKMDLSSAVY